MSPYFALYTVENNKNKKSVKFQGDMLNFCDFIQVFVFNRNHHLKRMKVYPYPSETLLQQLPNIVQTSLGRRCIYDV